MTVEITSFYIPFENNFNYFIESAAFRSHFENIPQKKASLIQRKASKSHYSFIILSMSVGLINSAGEMNKNNKASKNTKIATVKPFVLAVYKALL